jgi:N-acetylglucosaminyldiphosphoundecaprenol N-acetyl-beta-D-mannosaminyltransferase
MQNELTDTVTVGGFPTIRATRDELAALMVRDCIATRQEPDTLPKLVFSSNGQGISLAGSDPSFADAMSRADVIHADGMSVVIASRVLTKRPLPERICTTDFFHNAASAAVDAGLSFFLLGGTESQNQAAYEAVRSQYPELRLAGRHHGFIDERSDEHLCAKIVASRADVLWVALGKPRQEFWSVRNRHRLAGVGWIKTCGGLFSYITNDVPRAPAWMRDHSLEWLYRVMQEPTRLSMRYLLTNPHSLYRMVRFSR